MPYWLQVDDQLEQELCVPSSEDERRQASRKPERYNPAREHYKKLAVSISHVQPQRLMYGGQRHQVPDRRPCFASLLNQRELLAAP
jgi:hypothetical protein